MVKGLAVFSDAVFRLGELDFSRKRGILDEFVESGIVMEVFGGGVLVAEGVFDAE